MALTLTEEIIRNRVNLHHDNLEDVKALSLPGTYHEKVMCLGNSLRKFSRLKSLDLSRNSIASLQGLEHLKVLERLNLYYNGIETMDELKKLRFNTNLKDLDLRLNPVTRTEPDYRLYMIHMLPNLQQLDDRGVRDRERQAALVHFSSSQATEMTHHSGGGEPTPPLPNPRAEMIRNVGKGVSALDDDDVAILDLIARTGGDLSRPRPITGSSAREPHVQEYSLEVLKSMDSIPDDQIPRQEQGQMEQPILDDKMKSYIQKYPNIPVVNVTHHDDPPSRHDANLQYEDEADAYTKFKSHGYFTPHPSGERAERNLPYQEESYPNPPRVPTERRRSFGEDEDGHRRSNSVPAKKRDDDFGIHRVNGVTPHSPQQSADDSSLTSAPTKGMASETPVTKEFLIRFLDLVDRYWNGSKSLHKHAKFKGLAYGLIEKFITSSADNNTQEKQYLHDQLTKLQDENYRLRKREDATKSTLADSSVNETQLRNSLTKAYKEVEQLKDKVQKYMNENRKIQLKLQEVDETQQHSGVGNSTVNQTHLDDLQRQNEILKTEVEMLQIRLKQYGQLQELAGMLQDSHKSLVQTNEHLLQELDQTKRRHQHEVQQMNWSYEQLKKSMNLTTSLQRDTAVNISGDYSSREPPRYAPAQDTEKMSGTALFYGDRDS